ncbi:hypothetical protein [Pseudomonas phage vB_Pae_CF208a]|nr:hypothetical protein [Pseudomonas phage vB_Pae_CF208a]
MFTVGTMLGPSLQIQWPGLATRQAMARQRQPNIRRFFCACRLGVHRLIDIYADSRRNLRVRLAALRMFVRAVCADRNTSFAEYRQVAAP